VSSPVVTHQPKRSLPPRLRAGDAHSWTVQTDLPVGTMLSYVLTGVIANVPTRITIAAVAVDATGDAAFAVPSATSSAWLPGSYQWVLFAVDSSSNRTEVSQGKIRILPDVQGSSQPVDPRSYNEKVLASIRAVIAGTALDDVMMYKIGGRELTKIPRKDLLTQELVFENRVRAERIKRGEYVPTQNVGIRFGGGR
jgi:hypothetical protein